MYYMLSVQVYQAAAEAEITSELIRNQLGQTLPESKLRKVFGQEGVYDVKRSVSEIAFCCLYELFGNVVLSTDEICSLLLPID